MKKAATILSFVFLLSMLVLVYQNCGEQNLATIKNIGNFAAPSLPDPLPPNSPDIIASSNADYSNPKTSFNYGETVYEKVLSLDSNARGCVEIVGMQDGYCNNPASFVALSTISEWQMIDGPPLIWKTTHFAKNYHGMSAKQFLISGNTMKTTQFSYQSVAAATTSEIVVFASTDIAGLSVRNQFYVDTEDFYTHVKNGTGNFKICQYLEKNSDGTLNLTDYCANSTPTTNPSKWVNLPTSGPNVVSSGNSTLMSYFNPKGTYHKTQIQNYIHDGTIKHGPFWINYK